MRAKADCDIGRLKEQLKAATEALGEKPPENTPVAGYGESWALGSHLASRGASVVESLALASKPDPLPSSAPPG